MSTGESSPRPLRWTSGNGVNKSTLQASFVAVSLLVVACDGGGGLVLTAVSPQKTAEVELVGNPSRPTNYFVNNRVNFRALRGGRVVARGNLHIADWLDDGFATAYPSHDWPFENVLRFASAERRHYTTKDTIVVLNGSSRQASFITVRYCDLFVVLQLESGATVELTAPRDTTGALAVEAQLDGVARSLQAAQGLFYEREKPSASVKVNVELSDKDIRVSVR